MLLDVLDKFLLFLQSQILLNFTLQFYLHLLLKKRYFQLHPSLFYLFCPQLKLSPFSLGKLQTLEGGLVWFCSWGKGQFLWNRQLLLQPIKSLWLINWFLIFIGRVLRDDSLDTESPFRIIADICSHLSNGFF